MIISKKIKKISNYTVEITNLKKIPLHIYHNFNVKCLCDYFRPHPTKYKK